jgi:hypothetical protein
MMALARVMKAWWMSSRISQRVRSQRNQCSNAMVCSTTLIRSPSDAVRCTVPISMMQTVSCWRRCRACCLVLRGRCSS